MSSKPVYVLDINVYDQVELWMADVSFTETEISVTNPHKLKELGSRSSETEEFVRHFHALCMILENRIGVPPVPMGI